VERHGQPEIVVAKRKPKRKRKTRGAMLSSKSHRWFALFAALIMLSATMSAKTRVARQAFGHTSEGTSVDLYSLADGKVEVRILTYGGIILSLRAPDRQGKLDDV